MVLWFLNEISWLVLVIYTAGEVQVKAKGILGRMELLLERLVQGDFMVYFARNVRLEHLRMSVELTRPFVITARPISFHDVAYMLALEVV